MVQSIGPEALPECLLLVTNLGWSSKERANATVHEAVSTLMTFWDVPLRPVEHPCYSGVHEAKGQELAAWVDSKAFAALMASSFPAVSLTSTDEGSGAQDEGADQLALCSAQKYSVVARFEATHCLALDRWSMSYQSLRSGLILSVLNMCQRANINDQVRSGVVFFAAQPNPISY